MKLETGSAGSATGNSPSTWSVGVFSLSFLHLRSIIQFIDRLRDRHCIDTVKHESLRDEGLSLRNLLGIFPDQAWAEEILSALPLDSDSIADLVATHPTVTLNVAFTVIFASWYHLFI